MQVQRYRSRISGPLMDRIDLHIEVPAVEFRKLVDESKEEAFAVIRKEVSDYSPRVSGQTVYKNSRFFQQSDAGAAH